MKALRADGLAKPRLWAVSWTGDRVISSRASQPSHEGLVQKSTSEKTCGWRIGCCLLVTKPSNVDRYMPDYQTHDQASRVGNPFIFVFPLVSIRKRAFSLIKENLSAEVLVHFLFDEVFHRQGFGLNPHLWIASLLRFAPETRGQSFISIKGGIWPILCLWSPAPKKKSENELV